MTVEIHIPWFHYFANGVFRVLSRLLLDLDMEGLERTPEQGPLILAINHTSFLDPVLAITYIRPDILPMTKVEYFKFPYGFLFTQYGAFPVRRGEGDLSAIRRALQILRKGHVMLIAPEGTRTKSGVLEAAREGTALIALKSGAPILPVAMWGGKKFWHNLLRLRRTRVGLRVGEPLALVPLPGKPTREVLRAITDELMYYIARMLPTEYRGRYAEMEGMTPRYVKLEHEVLMQSSQALEREVMSVQT
jgi:1-acyl-sn-glycerol-3-phosphate acyltransferase